MPYIDKSRRPFLAPLIIANDSSGELNFIITSAIKDYIHRHGDSYSTYNDILGALEGAKLEFYRRKVVPYEVAKMEENGDVF
jgi:hypothetical protein